MSRATLITIPFSHYCEKARWALERLDVPFDEEKHVPIFHAPASKKAGGKRSVPVLLIDGKVLPDSTDILLYLDENAPSHKKLYPIEPGARQECLDLEDRFDEVLGPAARRRGYFELMKHPAALRKLFVEHTRESGSDWESRLTGPLLPLMIAFMRRLMKIDAAGSARSEARLNEIFAEVGSRLSDGRPYLLGKDFTAADLTFASLSAPILAPPEHPIQGMQLASLPPEAQALVERYRATPAGLFGLRLYAQERQRRL